MKKNMNISRREFVKALGVSGVLAGTSFEKLMAQVVPKAPLRVLILPVQFGWGLTPDTNYLTTIEGNNYNFPDAIGNLNSIKDKMLVINGLFGARGWGNAHDLSYSDILTGGVYFGEKSSAYNVHFPPSNTPSIETIIEAATGKEAFRLSALYRSWGASYHPLHWDSNGIIAPKLNSKQAFDSYFKGINFDSIGNESGLALGMDEQINLNIFGYLEESLVRRVKNMSQGEKQNFDRYLASVQKAKLKLGPKTGISGKLKLSFDGSTRDPKQGMEKDAQDFFEMVKVGFANNMTNIAVLSQGDRRFAVEIEKFHETHSHGNTNPWWETRNILANELVKFVNELDSIEDFDGSSLLDNTIIIPTGEVATGSHSHNFITPLIGGKNWIKQGQVIDTGMLELHFERNPDDSRTVSEDNFKGKNFYGRPNGTGTLYHVKTGGNKGFCYTRTFNDLFREICGLYGVNMEYFGLPALNRGSLGIKKIG